MFRQLSEALATSSPTRKPVSPPKKRTSRKNISTQQTVAAENNGAAEDHGKCREEDSFVEYLEFLSDLHKSTGLPPSPKRMGKLLVAWLAWKQARQESVEGIQDDVRSVVKALNVGSISTLEEQ